ncbi:MAG: hypothetical protein V5A55_01855 [Halovenus sp.]
MGDGDRLTRFVRTKLRSAGRQYEQARRAFGEGRTETLAELPTTGGKARIVCRRHAEKRAVTLDSEARPDCFEAGHPDCEGCVEDIRDGCIETWE